MKGRTLRAAVIAFPFAAAAGLVLLSPLLVSLGSLLPPCPFRAMTALWCPGCGMTRSVMSFLRGDLLLSVRYNPVPLFAAVLAALCYGELAAKAFGKRLRMFPRSPAFWIVCGSVFLVYAAVRNFVPFLRPL